MSAMVPTGSKYTDDQRKQAAMQYAVDGLLSKIEQQQGIPHQTLCDWKQTEWWVEIVGEVRLQKEGELDAKLTKLIDNSYDHALDELEKGDVTYSQALVGGSIAFDKQRILRNLPTSISASQDNRQLADVCKELSRTMRDHGVVSTQKQCGTK